MTLTREVVAYYLSDVDAHVRCRVEALLGVLPVHRVLLPKGPGASAEDAASEGQEPELLSSQAAELYVQATLYDAEDCSVGFPSRSRHTSVGANSPCCIWSEWLNFCAKYRDLTPGAYLYFEVIDPSADELNNVVGRATLYLFSDMELLFGRQKLSLKLGPEDGDVTVEERTPSPAMQELQRLERLLKQYESGAMERIDWLDQLVFSKIDECATEAAATRPPGILQLLVELPSFDHAVLDVPVPSQIASAQAAVADSLQHADDKLGGDLIVFHDPEIGKESPVELKQLKLERSVSRGVIDRDLKPNMQERADIDAVLLQPPTQELTLKEKALMWRFRYSLQQDKRALTKFLKCVDWGDTQEAKQAAELMERWSPIDTVDALELLSSEFTNEEVRSYAVSMIEDSGDEQILSILLQLVQALRSEAHDNSALGDYLIRRSCQNAEIANFLHWFVIVECVDPKYGMRYRKLHAKFVEAQIASGEEGVRVVESVQRQTSLVKQLCALFQDVGKIKSRRADKLRSMLSSGGEWGELSHFSRTLPMLYKPSVQVDGIVASECSVFKSALHPLRIVFREADGGGLCKCIFKRGDDLRQDQLIVQMIALMDSLLKAQNLDLNITPYKVLATGFGEQREARHGLIEFIPSVPVSNVLAEHKTIQKFFAQHHPDETATYGISEAVIEKYIRSCAGYCVIMYILGVGDRHLDNIMLCTDGRLFHIDFGFILGRDPKPFPPPMKLCKEMVEAMGGTDSELYARFRSLCCEAYNILRKSANLILNLFHLMAGCGIPDVDDPSCISKVRDKFRQDLDDEAAIQFFQQLIEESVNALFPEIFETVHRFAQYFR
mmetsp:Transcript_7089/g.26081  ORF Transcript_7089/g.26081 Transcript_7089/m.26081 type:complete len:838 (+) Transcript_7089:153-2666(+)